MISLIWAMDENRVIGKENKLPWHISEDLKFFKRVTMGHPIAMGRKTYESIGKPLPGRENIVITRNQHFTCQGCTVFSTIDELIAYGKGKADEIFVIGGAEIFKEVLPFADRLYVTMIHHQFEGDTYFPLFSLEDWTLIKREQGPKNEKNPYDYEFLFYERSK
ncbi:dihydrofolate reductase [Bacillus aquiflavi]|uniref:Dihydrofolate reductase n=1 Tax=Bacillus aquiflavi TaxID=2672567 RepID=A0A6B3W232_9BACI|nr:dihydrofolate reductase [Bacillus aquiflavi]MBA4537777.1 dihydrofolate reductase [Bacillus aquiflavi]NEY82033.1 dihydrofolate reductase [Bacillus aquiflavi]UAC46959.1 dihydrofolate reductase [Bacillus aquiflavi]